MEMFANITIAFGQIFIVILLFGSLLGSGKKLFRDRGLSTGKRVTWGLVFVVALTAFSYVWFVLGWAH